MKKAFIENLKASVLNREAQKTVVGGYLSNPCGSCTICYGMCSYSPLQQTYYCWSPGRNC